jgi:hypothetical protein
MTPYRCVVQVRGWNTMCLNTEKQKLATFLNVRHIVRAKSNSTEQNICLSQKGSVAKLSKDSRGYKGL